MKNYFQKIVNEWSVLKFVQLSYGDRKKYPVDAPNPFPWLILLIFTLYERWDFKILCLWPLV